MADLLVVDDESDVAAPLTEFLRLEGHAVRFARNGTQGLLMVARQIPELILLDVEMPQMSGPEMGHLLWTHNAGQERIPILLLSGTADLARIARQLGTPYFLAKPYSFDQLSRVLERALRERTAPHRPLSKPKLHSGS